MQTFLPAQCLAHVAGMVYAQYPATIYSLSCGAGADPGQAVIGWPQKYATPQSTKFGDAIHITIGGAVVFRGIIAGVPIVIDNDTDMVELHCVDDKWLISRNIIGQIGIGSLAGGLGFPDVGYDVVFNRDGRPDKDPKAINFNLGSGAVFWPFKSMLSFIFQFYVDSTAATLIAARLGSSYDRKAYNVNLVGQTAGQAIDTIVELAGESWGLMPTAQVSEFVPVKPGGWGRKQTITVNNPKGGQTVLSAGERHAARVEIHANIQAVRDQIQIKSGDEVRERTISSTGANPLLVRDTAFASPEFLCRFSCDVSKYAANNLGANRSSGARAKPWLPHLNTRLNAAGSAYLTAAEMAATPAFKANEHAPISVWVAPDGKIENAKLVTHGAHVDHPFAAVSLRAKIGVLSVAIPDNKTVPMDLTRSLATLAIWVTCATVLETFEQSVTAVANTYLPKPFTQLVRKDDIVPETREQCFLPSLTTGAMVSTAAALEKYLDVTPQLLEVKQSVALLAPKVANDLTLAFDFIPVICVGDLLDIQGRNIGQSGREVVTQVTYDIHESYRTTVQATDVIAGAGGGGPASRGPRPSARNMGPRGFTQATGNAPVVDAASNGVAKKQFGWR